MPPCWCPECPGRHASGYPAELEHPAQPIRQVPHVGRSGGRIVAEPDSLEIRSDVVASGLGMTFLDIYTLKVHIDSAARTFGFSGPVQGSAQRQGYSGMLSGRLRVRGAFVDPDRIRAQVRTALSISVTTPGGVSSGLCTPFDATIIATRATQ